MAVLREHGRSDDSLLELPSITNPSPSPPAPPQSQRDLQPAFYVVVWISLSSSVILFNKWILFTAEFHFPVFLTTWHLIFATLATQTLARTTTLLDGRYRVKMSGAAYLRAIVHIGFFFSLSLICGNIAYLTLSVAFIQMLKATTPVFVLLATWALSLEPPHLSTLSNISIIVLGILIASYVEIDFHLSGVIFQILGITFEATRLVMVQRLLSAKEGYKMDPLVSLYYFAPVCAGMNFLIFLVVEARSLSWADVTGKVGVGVLLANACVAFGLNVAVVFLIGRTSSLVLTLCGVLKDILLVILSILIYGTKVTLLQFLGYSIAIAGLVWYKVGAEKVREHVGLLREEVRERKLRGLVAVGVAAGLGGAVVLSRLPQPVQPSSMDRTA
ncbi:TPT-domain-containing protein [Wilcoxina mikolae CBS 423.85]|nr:TPT-domain-containing protein [Wilcoxina mikolae CBS 423.85]